MPQQKIPSGKLKRATLTGLTTAHIGLKHISHLTKKPFSNPDTKSKQKTLHEQEVGKILINTLMRLRGTALKVAQMMSMELDMLPEGIRVELAKACSQVTPLNRAHIHKVFIEEFNQSPDKTFVEFESTAFAAASLGQVHRAKIDNNQKLAVKIQYPAIAASIKSDVQLLRGLMKSLSKSTSVLPRYEIIDNVLSNIQHQLEQEIDYQQEADNTIWFAKHLKLPNIHVPTVYSQYSGTKVLSTEFVEGKHLDLWLQGEPKQAERNRYGQLLFDLFCFQLHELKVLHADPHPGNIIFNNNTISLIDFGCIHHLQSSFPATLMKMLSRDPIQLYQIYIELGIVCADLSQAQFKQEFYPVLIDMITWMTTPYQTKTFDFAKMPALPKRQTLQMKQAAQHLNSMQQDQMYFDRSYFGLLSMLRKMRANINTQGLLLDN